MSIFIAFNMLIITTKTNYDMCQGFFFLIAISSTRLCSKLVDNQSTSCLYVYHNMVQFFWHVYECNLSCK
jgi:hypothetical protein